MVCRHCLPGSLAIVAALGLITAAASSAIAQAEARIPSDVIASNQLSGEERQRVARYVTHWAGLLIASDDAQVTEARQRLVEPLRSPLGPSAEFLESYVEPLAPALAQALGAEPWFSRLNAMIVVANMPPEPALALIRQGVADENPAVRYWAMKSVARIAERHGWSQAEQGELLEVLTGLLRGEPTSLVVGQVMVSLVNLEARDAMGQTLEALNHRAAAHHAEPGRPLGPEHTGLEQLFVRLVAADEAEPRTHELRELARTSYRYMRLAARALDEGLVAESHAPAYRSIITLADRILREAHSNLNASQTPPGRVDSDVQSEAWAAVLVTADRWGAILQESPFNFTVGELALGGADGRNGE